MNVQTASLYLRVSQDKTGESLAVERQETECRELCHRNGWEVREVFTDNDISATTGKRRPGFEALLVSNPERIVCWHIDRLVRLSSELERVVSLKVNVHAVTAGHVDLSNPAGRAVARTIVAWAGYETEQKSLRQKAKGRQLAAAGTSWWVQVPFGFNRDGSHNEPEAAALRKLYGDLLGGRPVARLVDDLNEAGFRTNRGNLWTHVPLRTALLKCRNAGIRDYLGEEVGPAQWTAIIDEPTYRAAVRLLTNPSRKTTGNGHRVALLAGIAVCGVCGDAMGRTFNGGRAGDPRARAMYLCSGRHCSCINGAALDAMVIEHVLERLSAEQTAKHLPSLAEESEAMTDLHVEAERLRARILELGNAYAAGLVTIGQMTEATATLQKALGEVEGAMAGSARAGALAPLQGLDWDDAMEAFQGLDLDRKRGVVSAVLAGIVISPQGRGARAVNLDKVRLVGHPLTSVDWPGSGTKRSLNCGECLPQSSHFSRQRG